MKNNSNQILIAEDDQVVARIQKFLLEKAVSLSPVMCKNGREAFEFLQVNSEESDKILVLLDLNMPEMNGWDFLEACKESSFAEKVHVVVLTSSLFWEDEEKAASYEQVIGYYTKPITPGMLQEILRLPQVCGFFEPVLKSR
ncbi:response regulator [Salinimicrobium catena]|uniref:response regulator n=1 Tax=Salinimicrobium catena TaxID=390640 RepID=UPI002FE483DF